MKNLAELQQRKAILKETIKQQKLELEAAFQEAKAEIEPNYILKKVMSSFFSSAKDSAGAQASDRVIQLPGIFRILIDLIFNDSRLALLLKLAAPVALHYLPGQSSGSKGSGKHKGISRKAKLYGSLRKGVAALRHTLPEKKKATTPPDPIAAETTEN